MENATKALIIAGAVLLTILVISFGLIIINQVTGIFNGNGFSRAEISAFNAEYQKYEGTRVSGTTVNSMLQAVVANNLTQDDDARKITVKSGGSEGISVSTTANSIGTKALTSATYTVEITTYNSQGFASEITVTKN